MDNLKEQKKEKTNNFIYLPSIITVKDLAIKLNVPLPEIIANLMKNGINASINDNIDYETAAILALDFGLKTKLAEEEKELTIKELIQEVNQGSKKLNQRPPIVTVMGHVDHGKTLLLDTIRSANVVESEAGGITQHIGAYQVEKSGKKITFLDTPGHEAFVAMRARGAFVTDIVILVVAADDGVQPQTIESINHARNASLPIIVAINKIDKPEANPEKVKKQLSEHGLVPEEWGGKDIFVSVSAKTGEGISELLEMVLLVAETLELKADYQSSALGVILESHIDKGRGPVATVLIMNGHLKTMDNFYSGSTYGRVRIINNFWGQKINKAFPADPVVIAGFSELPVVGDIFEVVKDEEEAKNKANENLKKQRVKKIETTIKIKDLEKKDKKYTLKIILKADAGGSLEAIKESLSKIEKDDLGIQIIKEGIGDITESDVIMAHSADCSIFGFHIKTTPAARKAAKNYNIKINIYKVIYDLIQAVNKKLISLLPQEFKEVIVGKIQVLQIFKKEKEDYILGGRVKEGVIKNNLPIKIFRNNEFLGEGTIINLKKVDKDVNEVKNQEECGIRVKTDVALSIGDELQAIKKELVERNI